MSNLKFETFPNKPKKLKRRQTGTLKLHKSNNTAGQMTDFNHGTISSSNPVRNSLLPKIPNHDIDCKEETSKIDWNVSLNSFEFTFRFPNKIDSTKCFKVFSEEGPQTANSDSIAEDTGATHHRVKSIMRKSKIEGKKTISSETYKKVSFLEGLLKETTNSLNDHSTDKGRAVTYDANIRNKQDPTRKKDVTDPLINKSVIANAVENITIWENQLDMQSDFNQESARNRTSDKKLSPQNILNECTIQLSQEEKNCDLATAPDLQEISEPRLNFPEEHSLLQNLFEPGDYLNETQLFNGSNIYSSNELNEAEVSYKKTKLLYDQEIKSLDSAIRDLKIQRKQLAMKRRATKWKSFFWFAIPRKQSFVRNCDKVTSNKYSEEK